MHKELSIGLLLFGISMTLRQFIPLPEFLSGILLGLSICFELIGILPDRAYQKLKCFKRKLLLRK